MNVFEKAIAFTLRDDIEGGYTVDTGGPTNRGITLTTLKEANADGVIVGDFNKDGKIDEEDVKVLPLDVAIAIYKDRYWNALSLDAIDDAGLAIAAFDTAVNCGVGRTGRWLFDTKEKQRDEYYLLNFRVIHYMNLVTKKPDVYGKYKNGWLRRVNDLKKYIAAVEQGDI
jgi:lysozyme family protein